MKSKRAYEYINKTTYTNGDISRRVGRYAIEKAVELAEQDTRDRAVEAYCKHCNDSDLTKDMKGCYRPKGCKGLQSFINIYDK